MKRAVVGRVRDRGARSRRDFILARLGLGNMYGRRYFRSLEDRLYWNTVRRLYFHGEEGDGSGGLGSGSRGWE